MAIDGSTFVLDAWPVLELYRGRQPASTRFQQFLQQAADYHWELLLSRMTFGEIRYKAMDYFGEEQASSLLTKLSQYVTILSVDDLLIDEAAVLKHRHRQGYADCFVAAMARRHRARVVTGDPHFLELQAAGILTVEWLGA